jgi:two-component system nitrate/nitrite response regulator NarL
MTLRVLVVSDVRVVREGLHSVLARQPGVDVVGTVDLLHATDCGAQLHPDVVLFDAGRRASVGTVKEVVASTPRSKVVAFGVKETAEEILALAAAGTAGYIRDSVKSGDIAAILHRVVSGELSCSPRAAGSLYRCVATLSQGSHSAVEPNSGRVSTANLSRVPLSRRELQITDLIDRGLTNKEIGRQLSIEAATVKNHIHNICRKLGVHRRGEATARIRALLSEHVAPHAADSAAEAATYGVDSTRHAAAAPEGAPAPGEPSLRIRRHAGATKLATLVATEASSEG